MSTPPPPDEVIAQVDRIVFENIESGFVVIKAKEKGKKEPSTLVGKLLGVGPGQTIICQGHWRHKPQYGWSFEVVQFQTKLPQSREAILKYLGSGSIKGIGEAYAQKIVDVFGDQTLAILNEEPERLHEVSGIGPKRLQAIQTSWEQQRHLRELLLFLQPYDVSTGLAQKIYRAYGLKAIDRIQANPFDLARDVYGIGFKRADQIATKMGLTLDHPRRIQAAVEHCLEEAAQDGHTCLPIPLLIQQVNLLCEQGQPSVYAAIDQLHEQQHLHLQEVTHEGERQLMVWKKAFYASERSIASNLFRLSESPCLLKKFTIPDAVAWAQENLQLKLSERQEKAVTQACQQKVMILTGGPGTGKSTITKAILAIFQHLTSKILLAAPTGRAAKRLGEINGRSSQTLHQLLEFDPRSAGFKRNQDNPLEADLIIVDEASMLDTFLLHQLLKAVPNECRLILVGDIDQLPSVGPGNVLRDIIHSGRVHIEVLSEIYRQSQSSKIVVCAHEINRGIAPIHPPHEDDDFFFLRLENPEKIIATILSLVCERVPKKYGFNPITDIQVLAPMKKGVLGIENLNHQLQELIQSGGESITIGYKRFFIGDKLMQLRNNYQKEVFNGDLLYLKEIDEQARLLWATTSDERVIEYSFSELDEITHAYAVSVHKYQGSECPCIIMPVHGSHTILLQRNLLYTAVTRGKKLVILLGSPSALQQACVKQPAEGRHTGLLMALVERFGSWGGLFMAPNPQIELSSQEAKASSLLPLP